MHDTFLFENITNKVFNLCQDHNIKSLTHVKVSVNKDSHVSKKSLYHYLKETQNPLVGKWTKITVEYNNPEHLTAIIKKIEGD